MYEFQMNNLVTLPDLALASEIRVATTHKSACVNRATPPAKADFAALTIMPHLCSRCLGFGDWSSQNLGCGRIFRQFCF